MSSEQPAGPYSPSPREMLSVAEFERTMKQRGDMLEAKFSELRTVIESGFDRTHARLDTANGRLGKTEIQIEEVRTKGCALLEVHRALANDSPSRWHQKPIVQGGGGATIAIGLIEILKLLITHRW